MSLRKQLLIVSLLTLALPWAGCQYIREMEAALRADHETSIANSALAVAQVLAQRTGLLYPDAANAVPDDPQYAVYAHPLSAPVLLDGYPDDWGEAAQQLRDHPSSEGTSGSLHLQSVAGEDARYVYIFARVLDDVVTYLDPARGAVHDYLVVRWRSTDDRVIDALIETAAPGPVQARLRGSLNAGGSALRGYWQPNPGGYQIELRIPKSELGTRLGYAVVDGDGSPRDPPLFAGTVHPARRDVGPLVATRPALREVIAEFAGSGKRLSVGDSNGSLLATAGTLSSIAADAQTQSTLTRIYRWILDPELPQYPRRDVAGRLSGPDVTRALKNDPATLWYRRGGAGDAIVAASAPIVRDDQVVGVVTLEQRSAAILTLTHSALTRLVNLTVFATATAAIGLLGFATWLSLRIRRLRNAAEGALSSDGSIRTQMPGIRARDEIGDLSRSFAELLGQLRDYTDYLRSLAGKLSHELRTPLAVVQSSLENLNATAMTDDAKVYAQRASDGAQRLGKILVAMSEATRVEQSISSAEPERFDFNALLHSAAQGYQDTYPERVFEYTVHDEECPFTGVPELLVQMLDKLVENAVDFTPVGGTIRFTLAPGTDRTGYRLSVANEGSTLPPSMQGSLFDSLVSVREGPSERTHLGFGLFIARLIVQFHGGHISAHNLPTTGVEFRIDLPNP